MKKLLLCILYLGCGVTEAAIYKCKDAHGAVKVQDKPCGADSAMPVPRMVPAPIPQENRTPTADEPDGPPAEKGAEPEVLYRIDPATGHLIPVTVAPAAPPKPKGNWDRYAEQLEKENRAREAARQRSLEENQAAAEEFRRKSREYEQRQRDAAEQRAEQAEKNAEAEERFREEGE